MSEKKASETTLKLKHPIEFGSETISELVVRRPKARDFRGLPAKPTFGDILDMAGKLVGQPKAVIDDLDTEDLMPLMDMVGDFLPSSLTTGKNR